MLIFIFLFSFILPLFFLIYIEFNVSVISLYIEMQTHLQEATSNEKSMFLTYSF